MTTSMSTDGQTQAIPRVSAELLPVPGAQVATAPPDPAIAAPGPQPRVAAAEGDADIASAEPNPSAKAEAEAAAAEPDAEVAAAGPDADVAPEPKVEVARTESVQEMYEAGLANLEALYARWAAAMAELRVAQASDEPGEAAA
jgi:hypothetical protein